jgi:hypothetical protein
MTDVDVNPRYMIPGTAEPGWDELCTVLGELLASDGAAEEVELDRVKSRVYRLQAGMNGGARSFVMKRHDPWMARRNELVLRKWLPDLDLTDRGPRLLASAAERSGACVWHIYEDLGSDALDPLRADAAEVRAAVEAIAELHLRAMGHPLIPECRHYCGSLGASYFASNVQDAIAALEGVAPPRVDPGPEQGELRGRLLGRLYRLRSELPQRVQQLESLGGPDTLLHGDLWTSNVLIQDGPEGPAARLIDWDHAAVGPVSYDLSTFLYRFPRERRSWVLEEYLRVMNGSAWQLPGLQEWNRLFETAEYARYANRIIWPAMALVQERAAWGFEQLAEIERWFDHLELALPDA